MRNGNQRKSLSSSSSSSLQDCDVDLGLKMQRPRTASYSCAGDAGGGGGGGNPFFNGPSYHQPHIYDLANGVLLQRSLDNNTASRASGGMSMMPMCGKALFTTSQLQELERQKMIHKYMLASIPVPPQLLVSISTAPPPSLPQCNTPGLDLRFPSSGSDPEAWRCKRTDGKKWRCSRDVAPDQKYCERHTHKNRPRSRKHVEISPHNFSHNPNNPTTLPRPTSQFPATSYDQTRCIEWLMRGGNRDDTAPAPASACKQQQWDELMPSSRMELNRDKNDNLSVYHPQFADTQDFTSLSPITTDQTTRLFIDAWGKDGIEDGMSATAKERVSASAERKVWPSSSLSLSMSRMDDKGDLGIGMMMSNSSTSSSTSSEGIMNNHHQWLNPGGSWMNSSAPGGPLGEALCLGNANHSTIRGGYCNVASPHDHTNTSSCSKSSCEDGSHALNFIG